MEPDHWHQRWQEGRIGFHTGNINPWLERFYNKLLLEKGDTVLLPLCGKAADLAWLAEQGLNVIGVELSDIALTQFFEEQQLAPTLEQHDPFRTWSSGPMTLFEGDFFDFDHARAQSSNALFDRAALVALPAEMRERYVQHLSTILNRDTPILLVATDYPQEEKAPPPFAVSDAEVRRLYRKAFSVELLHSEDLTHSQDPLSKRGVSHLTENVYLIRKL